MKRTAGLMLIASLTAFAAAQTSLDIASVATDPLHHMGSDTIVEDSMTTLTRTDHSVAVELHSTRLEPGAIYTIWLVVFNNPAACSAAPDGDPTVAVCNADDIFNGDGDLEPNPLAHVSSMWGAGGIANATGAIRLSAVITEGEAPGEVLFGSGLEDARGAEVHVVLRTHGQPDAERLPAQLTSFETPGCETCANVQFSIFEPL